MGHYLAELIHKIDTIDSESEKTDLRKECCSLILEIWEKRERVPIEKPLERLKPVINVIELLKKREHPFIFHDFPSNNRDLNVNDPEWIGFLKVVKNNSEIIYKKSLKAMVSNEILKKDNEWVIKHGNLLSDDEKQIVEYLNSINELTITFSDGSNDEKTEKEKLEELFVELESHIEEQKNFLKNLKKEVLK
tara:strand:+ start:1929 stop:2504 length:576 start_codon:yes stop_codon:yes gene_type:complete